MTEHRLHPFAALRVLRKTLVLYLVPLLRVLFERNWAALRAALRQDLILFLLVCALSWVILHASSWSLDESGTFCLHWKLLFRFDRTVRGASLAALTIERPFYYRLAGASRVTLYPVGEPKQRTLTLCLRRADAQHLADQLLPIEAPACTGPKAASGLRWGCWGPTAFPRWRSFCWPSGRRSRARTAMSWPLRRSTFWPGWRHGGCPPVRPGCWPSPAFCWG